jgi:hypothetical protein
MIFDIAGYVSLVTDRIYPAIHGAASTIFVAATVALYLLMPNWRNTVAVSCGSRRLCYRLQNSQQQLSMLWWRRAGFEVGSCMRSTRERIMFMGPRRQIRTRREC